jgi:hypothetical protein
MGTFTMPTFFPAALNIRQMALPRHNLAFTNCSSYPPVYASQNRPTHAYRCLARPPWKSRLAHSWVELWNGAPLMLSYP